MKRILFLLAFVLAACRMTPGSGSKAWISEWVIDPWMTPRPNHPVSLVIVEEGDTYRVLLRDADRSSPVGRLTRQLGPDIPIQILALDLQGNRFLVLLVEAPLAFQARSIMLYRPDPDFPGRPDLSRQGKIIRLDNHGMGVAPIFPAEAGGWSHLARMVVTAKDMSANALLEKDFNPPLPLHFVTIDLGP